MLNLCSNFLLPLKVTVTVTVKSVEFQRILTNFNDNKKPAKPYSLRVWCTSLHPNECSIGADDWTRTSMTCVTTPSRWRVYQFHHIGGFLVIFLSVFTLMGSGFFVIFSNSFVFCNNWLFLSGFNRFFFCNRFSLFS